MHFRWQELSKVHFRKIGIGLEQVEQAIDKGGFACADLSGNDNNAPARGDAVNQMAEGFFVARRREEEVRVGGSVERKFFKFIKILIHYLELYHNFDIIKA